MKETEKRRMELLHETRKMYSERYTPPAVHPRYQVAYQSIYQNEGMSTDEPSNRSFAIRTMVAVLLLCLFAIGSERGMEETKSVANEIKQEFQGFELKGLVDFPILR